MQEDANGDFGHSITSVRTILKLSAQIIWLTHFPNTTAGVLINCNISTYMTGSSLIPLGLSWWQAIIAIVVGNILASTFIVLNSLPGAFYHCKDYDANRSSELFVTGQS